MRYATANAFRRALEERLLARSREGTIPIIRLRKLVAFDRLMARMMAVAPDRWVLKGAVALQFRAGPQYRTTKDIDFGRADTEDAATADFLASQSVDLGDYFNFSIEGSGPIDLEGEQAVRYRARAELAGRLFESFVVDVGFGGPFDTPETVSGPALLEFAEIEPIEVPTLPLERHIAEKIHAYTTVYTGGRPSSRVKDLVDVVLISSMLTAKAGRLADAIDSTFSERNSQPPTTLPSPPPEWQVPYRKMAGEVGIGPELAAGYERAKEFLGPILDRLQPPGAEWNPISRAWHRPS